MDTQWHGQTQRSHRHGYTIICIKVTYTYGYTVTWTDTKVTRTWRQTYSHTDKAVDMDTNTASYRPTQRWTQVKTATQTWTNTKMDTATKTWTQPWANTKMDTDWNSHTDTAMDQHKDGQRLRQTDMEWETVTQPHRHAQPYTLSEAQWCNHRLKNTVM